MRREVGRERAAHWSHCGAGGTGESWCGYADGEGEWKEGLGMGLRERSRGLCLEKDGGEKRFFDGGGDDVGSLDGDGVSWWPVKELLLALAHGRGVEES